LRINAVEPGVSPATDLDHDANPILRLIAGIVVVAKLRLETKGRGGKNVTVVYDLPNNAEFLKSLATELKKACGTGGTIAEDTVEIQGDYCNRIRQLLMSKGWTVKG